MTGYIIRFDKLVEQNEKATILPLDFRTQLLGIYDDHILTLGNTASWIPFNCRY